MTREETEKNGLFAFAQKAEKPTTTTGSRNTLVGQVLPDSQYKDTMQIENLQSFPSISLIRPIKRTMWTDSA